MQQESDGLTRRAAFAGAGALAATAATATDAAAAPHRIRNTDEQVLVEVVGRIAQDGDTLTGTGFVTRLPGVPVAALFSGPHDQTGARVTWTASAHVVERYIQGSLIAVTAPGTLTVRFSGAEVAAFHGRFECRLSIVAPGQAVAAISGALRQTEVRNFALGGRTRHIGRKGLRSVLEATGPSRRTSDAEPPQAVFDVAGSIDAG